MRIVSLCPSLTELVFDLGAGADLVGRTRFCVHPADRVPGVAICGGTKDPRLERIVELAPDLVLMNEEENRRQDADALRRAGLAVHASLPRTVAETAAMVRSIGAALGRPEAASRIAVDIEARAERARATAASRHPWSYAYLIWRRPWMSVSDDTFIAALLGLAGGTNVFGGAAERYPTVTLDELERAAPRVVLLSSEPYPFDERHAGELGEALGWSRERFRRVDGELLSWHGSRTPRGIDYADQLARDLTG